MAAPRTDSRFDTPGLTRYQFRVRAAASDDSSGTESGRVDATPRAKPARPAGLVANSADESVILHWDRLRHLPGLHRHRQQLGASAPWAKSGTQQPWHGFHAHPALPNQPHVLAA